VLDKPQHGRQFFEQVIRENLDRGRPEQMHLIFGRRVQRNMPGLFRTRILTQDVTPSLHVYYKNTRIKQYHKESRALRTETTINNARDFGIGKRLCNLPALRAIGFAANRRLIEVERLSHDCVLPLSRPASQPRGLVCRHAQAISQGAATYQLRRLRLHGLIERVPKSFRYRVTDRGLRVALFFSRVYNRLLRPGLAAALPGLRALSSPLKRALDQLDIQLTASIARVRLAA
jgi:hypothetical protein